MPAVKAGPSRQRRMLLAAFLFGGRNGWVWMHLHVAFRLDSPSLDPDRSSVSNVGTPLYFYGGLAATYKLGNRSSPTFFFDFSSFYLPFDKFLQSVGR
ncbi:hypothetical protein [Rugamonas sp.]|uniref:hypothetical protein n=1 Tax=Rugamonas sp. TaxID=1926287 RepID=UPI0025F7BA09|nr:hypothetical protein [Rugamonas sp.]